MTWTAPDIILFWTVIFSIVGLTLSLLALWRNRK